MARKFDIPDFYKSNVIATVKAARRALDQRKKDFSPSELPLGPITFKIARHFGFCFGVENAIEIAYRAISENPDRKIFLLSEMIHNPEVNNDLQQRGVRFLFTTEGEQITPLEELSPQDVVIVPAFGTTVELLNRLEELGIDPYQYNTTCPFVEKVWKRAGQLGERGFTIVIHGKHTHEETRATFSHARLSAPSIVVRDIEESRRLAKYITAELPLEEFEREFRGRVSEGFNPSTDLTRIGVVNQTTMLATETQQISQLVKEAIYTRYGDEAGREYFADTRDTLCYATSENQSSIYGLLESGGDLAIVVGGYNSSNTSHLVELLQEKVPTYYIKDCSEILDSASIKHLEIDSHTVITTRNWLPDPQERPIEIMITAGASCPDALVDRVIAKIASFHNLEGAITGALEGYSEALAEAG